MARMYWIIAGMLFLELGAYLFLTVTYILGFPDKSSDLVTTLGLSCSNTLC